MAVALTLLQDVRWRGTPVSGDRPRALLAALAEAGGRPVSDDRLVELIWGEDPPANAHKSLQVLVSRTRTALGPDAIVRDAAGYRLGVGPDEVDSARLAALVAEAAAALDRDPAAAQDRAREALALADDIGSPNGDGALLAAVRAAAVEHARDARVVLARAESRLGAHAAALPALEAAHAAHPDDESLLADLLRSEAAVRGPGAAIERYERYRRDLRDRLGAQPGERLQRTQRELLALDRPQRTGVRFDATPLVGRDADIEALRGLLSSARVVSIVGPGGIGKTRLAHVLARETLQPAVHVVELVGVTSPDDVVAEVGSVLGVRDSVSARRTLTPQQRADVRGRIAQQLGQVPSLLVLDNCEHVVGAVAELVAFLVSTTADLTVLTTSRAPLAIAAERVYQLGQLDAADAARLFADRARAARPGVALDDETVRRIVARLDGLPLAIELAAARVRAMSVEEIDRRLEDRFALLRGGDRAAPDRHQTLLAVIDWSWNLLEEHERRALRWLALFNDGFTLDAAASVLGDEALDAVQGLVDQSLLSVREAPAGVRYRMLETVREFGLMQLVDAGDEADARAARRRWAVDVARRWAPALSSRDQVAAIDALDLEETNLADELRDAFGDGDPGTAVELLAALGMLWTIRGEHGRVFTLAGELSRAIDGWTPPPELEHAARVAMVMTLTNAMIVDDGRWGPARALLERLGPGDEDPRLAAAVRLQLGFEPGNRFAAIDVLERAAHDPDPDLARAAYHWLGHARENAGDPQGALAATERALELTDADEGPWLTAMLNSQVAQLAAQLGDPRRARVHAQQALPVMARLGARDDELQLRSLLVACAIADGRLDEAEAELAATQRIADSEVVGGLAVRSVGAAELALARGDHARGLREHRASAARLRELRFPGLSSTGGEPWAVFGEASALVAHAYHAGPADEPYGRELYASLRRRAPTVLDPFDPALDVPVAGVAVFALGVWALLRDAAPVDDAVALLALAQRCAYNRALPTMAWERIAPHAEARAPGRLAALDARYATRSLHDVLGEARDRVARLPA
ncbi:MAG TPA: BTAD domain-containing putative transcriptional regulator [Capillimicrobium sp.]|nr:BTAD domain-containing putative transcriptional regulator [Capillimicrobium sp.]